MNNPFKYEWKEYTKGRTLSLKLIWQTVLLSFAVGLGPDVLLAIIGSPREILSWPYRIALVSGIILVIILAAAIHDRAVSVMTTSTLEIGAFVHITRHVTAETGRQFFVQWDSFETAEFYLDERHRIIQIDTGWNVRAYERKRTKKGAYIDQDIRFYPQTLQLSRDAFYEARAFLRENYPEHMRNMYDYEYERAKPFILKHYGT